MEIHVEQEMWVAKSNLAPKFEGLYSTDRSTTSLAIMRVT